MSIECGRARRPDRCPTTRRTSTWRGGPAHRGGWASRGPQVGVKSDEGACSARDNVDAGALAPKVTLGTNPGKGVAISGACPRRATRGRSARSSYMGLRAGTPAGRSRRSRFIGVVHEQPDRATCARRRSCAGAAWPGVGALVSAARAVKARRKPKGLDRVFRDAGFDWRMRAARCARHEWRLAAPAERGRIDEQPQLRGRQGPGARTHL